MKKFIKQLITAAYWEWCYEEDDYMERLAVCNFDPQTPDDIVVAELDDHFSRANRRVYFVRRFRFLSERRS